MVEPGCSLCGRKLRALEQNRYANVSGSLPILYDGVICKKCGAIICMACQGTPPSKPCKKCSGEVAPAYADELPSDKQHARSVRRAGIDSGAPSITVCCTRCKQTYAVGENAIVVSFEAVKMAELAERCGGAENIPDWAKERIKRDAGTKQGADLVSEGSPEEISSAGALIGLSVLLHSREANSTRFWRCDGCDAINPYPWSRAWWKFWS